MSHGSSLDYAATKPRRVYAEEKPALNWFKASNVGHLEL